VTTVRWTCDSCGRLAIEVRTPPPVDPVKYAPSGKCGWCGGTTYTRREAKAA